MANRVCEKCIHYDVCLLHEDNFIDDVAKNGFCGKFKNKADFVEVVRCKECIHKTHSNKRIMCKKDAVKTGMGFYYGLIATEPNNFCSYGKRRDT